jgi:long-subunit acyl-CoA synthetase (AMP-forming)
MTEFCWVTTGSNTSDEFIPGNAGTVAPGCELKIIDLTTGESLGPGRDGEICVRGNKLFAGYLDNEKANLEAIDRDGWYRTGDIGRYDSKERLFITDRLKEVVRIGIDNHYINISPVEIEQFLLTHPSIAEVAVVGVNNKSGTHWPRAYVILKPGVTGTTAEGIEKFVFGMYDAYCV